MTTTTIRSAIGLPASAASLRDVARVAGVTVHHSDGLTLNQQAGQTVDDAARWVRNIWAFHTNRRLPAHGRYPAVTPWSGARGWDDIGYHRLLHLPTRTEFHGRPVGRVGAHAPGANVTRLGVCILGGNPAVTDADVAWIADRIDALRADIGYPTPWTIDGHRDWRPTGCPGANLYRALPALADPNRPTPPDAIDPTGDTVERILARLDRTDRIAAATLAAQIAAHRAAVGLPPSPVDDQRWTERIADDRATIGEALQRITDKASSR